MTPEIKYIKHTILGTLTKTPSVFSETQIGIINNREGLFIEFCGRVESIIRNLSEFSSFTKKDWQSLSLFIFQGLCDKDITFISLNSHGLVKESRSLRDKPQYKKNYEIGKKLNTLNKYFNIRYCSILVDIDADFGLEEYSKEWDKNIKYLTEVSRGETYRLSGIMEEKDFYFFEKLETFVDFLKLTDSIKKYRDLDSLKIDFNASEEFIEKQIKAYTSVGLVLEKHFPNAILLDVQKKYYPFEQPFYNFGRKVHLPLLYCGY